MVLAGFPQRVAGSGEQVAELFGVELEPLAGRGLDTDAVMSERNKVDEAFAAHHVGAAHVVPRDIAVRVLPMSHACSPFLLGEGRSRRPSAGRYWAVRDLRGARGRWLGIAAWLARSLRGKPPGAHHAPWDHAAVEDTVDSGGEGPLSPRGANTAGGKDGAVLAEVEVRWAAPCRGLTLPTGRSRRRDMPRTGSSLP